MNFTILIYLRLDVVYSCLYSLNKKRKHQIINFYSFGNQVKSSKSIRTREGKDTQWCLGPEEMDDQANNGVGRGQRTIKEPLR